MTRRLLRKPVDRRKHVEYIAVAEHFTAAARDSMELEYWTAASVLIVHAAIAFADALAIKLTGHKSAGDNHEDAIALLNIAVADSKEKAIAMNHLRRIIEVKTKVSYLGEIASSADAREMLKQLDRFRKWARVILVT